MVERPNFHERQTQNGGTQLTLDDSGWGIRLRIMSIWQTRTFISFRVKSRYDKELQARKSRRACLVFFFHLYRMDSPFLPSPTLFSLELSPPFLPPYPARSFPSLPFGLPPSFPRRFLQIIQDCNRKCFWQANCIKIGRGPSQGLQHSRMTC